MDVELSDLSLTQAVESLRRGDVSSRELTEACLSRIDSLEPRLHAFLTITASRAIEQADTADQAFSRARHDSSAILPPLLGLPIAIKDVLCTAGVRTTCGSAILGNFIPPFNATAVARLLEAGVVVLGKTNTDEFAMGSSTENSAFGPTHNPWDIDRVPGGSSGGSASAVASRMLPAALGTDTGGSVRQPASFCGVTGIKPTYGRVSRYGLIAYGSSLDSVGALGRNARDVAALFQVMVGPDPLDSTCLDVPSPSFELDDSVSIKGLRIGVPQEYFVEGIQPEVEEAVRAAVDMLESLGASIQPVSLPHTSYALPVYYLIAPAEASANLARYDGVRFGLRIPSPDLQEMYCQTRGEGFGAEVKRRIMLGTYALSAGYYEAYYGQAQKVRTLIKADFDDAFRSVDAIAAPVAPTTAFRLGEHTGDPLAMYLEDIFTLPANLAGIPGLAFPVGFDRQGLPIGMQLMGKPLSEETLFRLAHAYQLTTDWHTRKPNITVDPPLVGGSQKQD